MIYVTWTLIAILVVYTLLRPFTILGSLFRLLGDILQGLADLIRPKEGGEDEERGEDENGKGR